jgi:hypothetical protein
MKAIITKTGKNVGYRWQVNHNCGFALTHIGAIYAARKCANSLRQYKNNKENAEVLEV